MALSIVSGRFSPTRIMWSVSIFTAVKSIKLRNIPTHRDSGPILLAALLFLLRAKEFLYPLGSTILILMLHPHGCVRYPTIEAEDSKLRVSGCAVRFPHVGVYPRQSCHDGANSVSAHNRQKVRSRCFCSRIQPLSLD